MSSDHSKYYVAPPQPPQARRPPATEVGIIGWLRHNLFSNLTDSVTTILTLIIFGWFLYEFFAWVIFNSQWEVAFLNLKNIGAGPDFPASEMWRVNLAGYILVALGMAAVGFWGSVPRIAIAILVVISIAMILIPLAADTVEEPSIFYFYDLEHPGDQVNFVADEGDEIVFTLDPLTDESDYVINDLEGYIGNDNQLADTSWDLINAASQMVSRGEYNPADYDLNMRVQVLDENDVVVAESDFTEGSPESIVLEWEVPESAWYTFTVSPHPENPGTQGQVWLKVDQLEAFYSTYHETLNRVEKYGAEPTYSCTNCGTSTNRTDLRYNGSRTVGQFFSLQLAPYLLFTREFFFVSLIVGTVAYWIGKLGRRHNPRGFQRALLMIWVIALVVMFFIILGFQGNETLPYVSTSQWGGIVLTLLLSSIAITAAFPIGIALALGRQSSLPAISFLSTVFIEVLRGVPLITLLFMGLYIVPFFHSSLENMNAIIRMSVVLTLFLSAYLAEVVRGGLQIVPKGQIEAAKAVGLTNFQTTTHIVLPQALRAVIPAILGQFVSLFKDTSLVALVGFGTFEIMGTMRRILGDTQTGYSLFPREGYLYIGILYFVFSYIMAEASRKLEESGAGAARRNQI